MAQKQTIDAMWDDSPIDVSTEVNFIWSIANKLRGTYQSDKYKDVIIPMVIIRRLSVRWNLPKTRWLHSLKQTQITRQKLCIVFRGFSSTILVNLHLQN